MKVIEVSASKGGVGTTTTACGIALASHAKGNRTLLVGIDDTADIMAILGSAAEPEVGGEPEQFFSDNRPYGVGVVTIHAGSVDLSEIMYGDKYDIVVVDAGVRGKQTYSLGSDKNGRPWVANPKRVRVIRNCYMSLRRELMAKGDTVGVTYLCYMDSCHSMTANDVQIVLAHDNIKVITTPLTPQVAVSIDAGTYALHGEARDWTTELV